MIYFFIFIDIVFLFEIGITFINEKLTCYVSQEILIFTLSFHRRPTFPRR